MASPPSDPAPAPRTTTLAITGMSCGNCTRHVREALSHIPGVTGAEVDLARGTAKVTHHPDRAPVERLLAAVQEEGYEVEVRG